MSIWRTRRSGFALARGSCRSNGSLEAQAGLVAAGPADGREMLAGFAEVEQHFGAHGIVDLGLSISAPLAKYCAGGPGRCHGRSGSAPVQISGWRALACGGVRSCVVVLALGLGVGRLRPQRCDLRPGSCGWMTSSSSASRSSRSRSRSAFRGRIRGRCGRRGSSARRIRSRLPSPKIEVDSFPQTWGEVGSGSSRRRPTG